MPGPFEQKPSKDILPELIFLALICTAAFCLRACLLDLFPLNHDEINNTMAGLGRLDSFFGIPVSARLGYMRPLLLVCVLLAKRFFASAALYLRLPMAVAGTLTLPLLFWFGRRAYGAKTGLLACLLMAFLPWHVLQSRIGTEPILAPLCASLLALLFLQAVSRRSGRLFVLFAFFLGAGSLYTYEPDMLLIPIYAIVLFCLRRRLSWLGLRAAMAGALVFLAAAFPLLWMYAAGRMPNFLVNASMVSVQPGASLFGLLSSLARTAGVACRALFVSTSGTFLYAQALIPALLIHWVSAFLILYALIRCLRRRGAADIVLSVWLCAGTAMSLLGTRCFQARYALFLLPAFIVLLAMALSDLLEYSWQRTGAYRYLLFVPGLLLSVGLVSGGLLQTLCYLRTAPLNTDECRMNSYGCREAAEYLLSQPDIKEAVLVESHRMTVAGHLCLLRQCLKDKGVREGASYYYAVWAPESHDEREWQGASLKLYMSFRERFPGAAPVWSGYYPSGLPALYLFRIKEGQ